MMVGRFLDYWSCVVLIGLCLRFVEGKMIHHHQPYHSKPLAHGNDIRLIALSDGEYKPAVGEILAKDSILYSQQPETRLLRRQLWPIMQETMDTLVGSVTAGANLFKNMIVPNTNPLATKIRNIKNAYISSARPTMSHSKSVRHPTMKKVRKVKKSPETIRTKTVSEDYVHTYNDGAYTVPSYVVKFASQNPYSQMGLKNYKHFEETVLRELEEKEEKKIEASMAALFNKKKVKHIGEEPTESSPDGDWRPMKSTGDDSHHSHHIINQPRPVGKLHTNIAASNYKPIHEEVAESQIISQVHETIIQPETNSLTKSKKRKPNSNRTTTTPPPKSFTRKPPKEEPNYPEYFLNKQKDAAKDNRNTQQISQEINYLKRMKFYREHMEIISTTSRPPSARDSFLNDSSEEKFVFITPLPKSAQTNEMKMQRTNRQKTVDKSKIGNRGNIKFSDSS
ncbi:hypothetical protein Bhyg_07332 [Pseudolycoriella hygida]|uniref:Uncharacterized protein n=1 Tax=Pseudolycoriella hygida TaxID=35572 RepID=A0A9Q0N4C7_9DIPT|nr:hypothetical protein Bhyg_07332 [Pseudolycoriella hygida]